MAEITLGGVGSIETLVKRFIAPERKPIEDLQAQKKELQRRQTVYTDLKSKLQALRDIVKAFSRIGSLNNLYKKTATSSNDKYLSVTATSAAELGNHTIRIDRLATVDTGISTRFDRTGNDLAPSLSGLQEFTLATGSGTPVTISVNIDNTDTNEDIMTKVRDAVNNAGLDVTASIIKDTRTTSRLVIKSKTTGSANYLNMEEIGGSKILSDLGYIKNNGDRILNSGTTGGFLVQDFSDLDAKINVDGIDIIKDKNEITDIFEGVTFKLLQAQDPEDTPLTFSVETDTENAKIEIEKFIEKYNDVIKYLIEKTKVDPVNFVRGDLTGIAVFSSLKFSIRSIVMNGASGLPQGELQFLSQIGIKTARDGTLSIAESDKFDDALNGNLEQVTNLFTSENGIGQSLTGLLDKFVSSGGTVDRSKKGLKRRISSIDTRIKNFEARLLIRAESLRRRFTDLQRMLSLLNSQRSFMQSQMAGFQAFGGSVGGFF